MQRAQLAEGVELDPLMEREREGRLEAIKARLLALVAEGRGAEAADASVAAMLELERECERLFWRVLRAERYGFGHQSEKVSREELEALARDVGASASEAAVEEPQIPTPTPSKDVDSTIGAGEQGAQPAAPPAKEKKTRNRKEGGSTVIDPKVERRVTRVAVPESERCCGLCGREKSPMLPVVHEALEFEPAKIVLRIQEREQLSCSSCRQHHPDHRAGAIAVARGNQADVATSIQRDALTSREAARLVTLFAKTSGAAEQRHLLAKPREVLEAQGAREPLAAPDPRLGFTTQSIHPRLFATIRTSGDVCARLAAATPASWSPVERKVLLPALTKTHGITELLVAKLAEVVEATRRSDVS